MKDLERRRILIEGRPGSGKSTVAERLIAGLRTAGIPVAGFVTGEIRERGRRVGFSIETPAGEKGVLAHVDLPGPPRVGKYGVDLPAFERIALPALAEASERGVAVIDELGKMELASPRFRDAVDEIFDRPVAIVATVQASRDPFTDRLKGRDDVEVRAVTREGRDRLPAQLLASLGAG